MSQCSLSLTRKLDSYFKIIIYILLCRPLLIFYLFPEIAAVTEWSSWCLRSMQ